MMSVVTLYVYTHIKCTIIKKNQKIFRKINILKKNKIFCVWGNTSLKRPLSTGFQPAPGLSKHIYISDLFYTSSIFFFVI